MRAYPSKLLLFGEHVLLIGSSALAVPMPAYSGKWLGNGGKEALVLERKLMQFAYSKQLQAVDGLQAAEFLHDLQNGLRFDSSIPIGYGLGSSGALCAAVYDRYCLQKTNDLSELKAIFAQMESFFHGSSSGIDPLTSYLAKPLLIRQKTSVQLVEMAPWEQQPIVFLIDSAMPRQTGPLVQWFLAQWETPLFANTLQTEYLPAHERMIQSWMEADAASFWPTLRQVSRFQFDYFVPMIPATLRSVWSESFDSQDITFKVCGAGGGGFMLGFSQSMEPVQALAQRYNIIFPFSSHS